MVNLQCIIIIKIATVGLAVLNAYLLSEHMHDAWCFAYPIYFFIHHIRYILGVDGGNTPRKVANDC